MGFAVEEVEVASRQSVKIKTVRYSRSSREALAGRIVAWRWQSIHRESMHFAGLLFSMMSLFKEISDLRSDFFAAG